MAANVSRLVRLPEVMAATGLRSTSIYSRAKAGLFTPPIKITSRCSAWPEREIAAINAATIAGKSDEEIREVVKSLVEARTASAKSI